MKKRLKTKSKLSKYIKYTLFLVGLFLIFQITYTSAMNINLNMTNEEFISKILDNSTSTFAYENASNNILNKVIEFMMNINIKKPSTIIDQFTGSSTTIKTKHINYQTNKQIKTPIVYIYNSHQLEEYDNKDYDLFGITPNVMMASYLLQEKLLDLGINAVVEDGNIIEFMKINNWQHKDSYKASRYFIEAAKQKYPSIKYYIDIHRDTITKEEATVNINGKECAKVLFVVGMDYDSYLNNLKFANELNEIIQKKYPKLTRGVLKKSGSSVNGVYNQDFSPSMILLEMGSSKSKIDEVLNTIEIFSEIFNSYIGG